MFLGSAIRSVSVALALSRPDVVRHEYHSHTNESDGALSPTEIIDLFLNGGVSVCAITDHNTFAGSRVAFEYAPESIAVIPGIELSTSHSRSRVHILGYFDSYRAPHTSEIIQRVRSGHMAREMMRLNLLKHSVPNLKLTESILFRVIGERVPNWLLVARALVQSGDAATIEAASSEFLREGKAGHLSYSSPWPQVPAIEAVRAISNDGGLAFIAHPGDVEMRLGPDGFSAFLSDLTDSGLIGFEITASERHHQLSDEMARYLEHELQLARLSGSDYHGGALPSQDDAVACEFLGTFVAHYGSTLPQASLDLHVEETIAPVQCPASRFDESGRHAVADYEASDILTISDLLESVAARGRSPSRTSAAIQRASPFLDSATLHAAIEASMLEMLNDLDPHAIVELVTENVAKANAPLYRLLNGRLREVLRDPRLELQYPLGYRLCRYDQTLSVRTEALETLSPDHYAAFSRFYVDFSSNQSFDCDGLSALEMTLNQIASRLEIAGIQIESIVRRGLKSSASAYEKFVRTWLCERRPSGSRSTIEISGGQTAEPQQYSHEELLRLWPDLFAATVIIKTPQPGSALYSYIAEVCGPRILDEVNDLVIAPRRWYHNRLYVAGRSFGVPLEIMFKTRGDYWLSRFYYWMTKGGRLLFDRRTLLGPMLPPSTFAYLRRASSEHDLYLPAWFEVLQYLAHVAPSARSRECLTTASTSILDMLTNK